MLVTIAERLDNWVIEENRAARATGMLSIGRCRIRLLGQMALFEQRVPLHLVATSDVDERFVHLAERYKLNLEPFL